MGLFLLVMWGGHLVLFTAPGLLTVGVLAWKREDSRWFWPTTLTTAVVALAAQVAWMAYRYRGVTQASFWDVHFHMLYSHALFVTLGLAVVLGAAGLAIPPLRRGVPGVAAGLGVSLALQLPLAFKARALFAHLGLDLTY